LDGGEGDPAALDFREDLVGEVGHGRGVGVATGPFPVAACPNPTYRSLGIGLSTCLDRWSAGGVGCRFRGPGSRDVAAAVAVAGHGDAGCAGEYDSVVGRIANPGRRSRRSSVIPMW